MLVNRSTLLLLISLVAPVAYGGYIAQGPTVFGTCTHSGGPVVSDTSSPLGLQATFTVSLTAGGGSCSVQWYLERQITPAAGDYFNTLQIDMDITNPTGHSVGGGGDLETTGHPLSGVSGSNSGINSMTSGPLDSAVYTLDGSEVTLRQRLFIGWGSGADIPSGETYVFTGVISGYVTPLNAVPEPGTSVLLITAVAALGVGRRLIRRSSVS